MILDRVSLFASTYYHFTSEIGFIKRILMTQTMRVAVMLDLQWPYKRHSDVFAGTQQYAGKAGNWDCVVDERVLDSLPISRRKSIPYDGVIARATAELEVRAGKLNLPVVNVWLGSPARNLAGVFPDFVTAARMRAEHLLSRGFRNFASLTFRRDQAHKIEADEFARVVGEQGYACQRALLNVQYAHSAKQWRHTQCIIRDWMAKWTAPIGIYVGAEEIGRHVAQLCRSSGLRVPYDVAIIAGLNQPTLCEHPAPGLTSVEIGYERVGFEAARLLDRLMDGDVPTHKHILIPPVGIVARQSTDFIAVEDQLVAAALKFIAERGHTSIGVAEVAAAVATSRATLERRFRAHLGRPIAAEIRRLRIERAKRGLAETDRSIGVIALDAGFSGAKSMCRVFQRDLGLSPGEFRRSLKTH
jgi:LacI family transcriptional regulator